MLVNPLGYNPLDILRQRRERRLEVAANAASKAGPDNSVDESGDLPTQPARPEGLGGILFDAKEYLTKTLSSFEEIYDKFDEMNKLLKESLNLQIDDEDRKKIHKKFTETRTALDTRAKNLLVDGDPLFSGKFANKPKSIRIGSLEEEVVNIRIDALTSEKLGLERSRVDSMVNARKTAQTMEKAKSELDTTKKYIQARLNTVQVKYEKWDLAQDKGDAGGRRNQAQSNPFTGSTDARYVLLRQKQQQAAAAKGRDRGLLVNLRF